jgi:hypothetical protein
MNAQNRFKIFPCGEGGWCCKREDSLVCGFFVSRESAERFAQRESRGQAEIRFTAPEPGALPRAA